MNAPPTELIDAIRRSSRPLILGHVRPDADCLGSMFALAAAAAESGRVPSVYYRAEEVSQRLAFLCRLSPRCSATSDQLRSCDAILVLDAAQQDRAAVRPPLAELGMNGTPVINIDHHIGNTGFGTINWVAPRASSTSEMAYRLLLALEWRISPEIATLLYAGIHTDTHGFSLPNTTASALQVAGELVATGARVADLCERLCRSQTRSEFDLERIIYDNVRVTADGCIAYSTATYEEITSTGCTAADIDEQVSIPRSLRGIRIAILFSEGRPNRIRMNFRGEGGTDVLELAREFGGGGHKEAAGAVVNGTMDEVVTTVLARAGEILRR